MLPSEAFQASSHRSGQPTKFSGPTRRALTQWVDRSEGAAGQVVERGTAAEQGINASHHLPGGGVDGGDAESQDVDYPSIPAQIVA